MVSLLAWKTACLRQPILAAPPAARPLARGRLALACLLLLAWPAWAAPKFETSLDRDTIRLGETTTLSMSFTDCSPEGEPSLPRIAGLQYGSTGTSTKTVFNGSTLTQTTTYTLELRPTHAGDFTIPALTITLNGARLASHPLELKVLSANTPSPAPGNEPAFIRLQPATNTLYLGQTIPVELQCYCQDNAMNLQLPQLNADDFIIGAVPRDPQRSGVRVGNGLYNLLVFRVSATPTKTGALTLGPATWALALGTRSIFGPVPSQQLNVSSEAAQIRVQSIPTNGAPADFNGAIGHFTLAQCEASPTEVGVGDPITLKIRIAGSGAFGTVTLPANAQGWREFKTYPPTSKLESTDPLQIEGSKYFEQVITPLNAEIREIPPFTFSYFDPAAGAYRTLSHPGIPLSVHATAATPQPTVIASGAPQPDAPAQNQEIVHIKPEPGRVGAPAPPLVLQPLFLTMQAVAPLAWLGALAWRRQKDKLANNPRLRRRRDVARQVAAGLAELPALAAANDADKFYSTVLALLREQLGERLDLPAPAITEAVLEECNGLAASVAPLTRELFHACNQYHYTPEHTAQELASLIPKVKTVLAGLRDMPEAGGGVARKLLQGAGCLLLLAAAAGARAESVSDSFTQANKLYEEGKFSQAAAAYDGLLKRGQVSPAIYFNAGNAWFKAGRLGRAVEAYRRALAPRDPDIRANLQIVRAQAGNGAAALPGNRWTRWIGRLTLNEWTAAASAAAALFFILLTARRISPAFARATGGWPVILAALSVWLLACLALSIDQRLLEKSAVVLVSEAVARRGPMDESQSAFTAHDGAELIVEAREGDWLKVSDAARRIGWLQQKDVALMP